MREILFRGKRIDTGEWVYGYYVFRRKRRGIFGQTITELDFDTHYIVSVRGESFEVDPKSISQFTGCHDKNGKRIFERDIVFYVLYIGMGYREIKGEVVYRAPEFIIDCKHNRVMNFSQYDPENRDFEVIGNIYDNPELLEVRE